MAAKGPVRLQDHLPQEPRGGEGGVELNHPALATLIRFRNREFSQSLQVRDAEVEIDGSLVEAVLPEGLGQGDQLLQQGELILQSLQGRRGGARLGLAIGQGLERLGIDQSIGRDGAAAEAEVLQLPLGVQVEGD